MRIFHYGHIVAKITSIIEQQPDHVKQINGVIGNNLEDLWDFYSDAGMVFDRVEELTCLGEVDVSQSITDYANAVRQHLLLGDKPAKTDLVSMAARSIEDNH